MTLLVVACSSPDGTEGGDAGQDSGGFTQDGGTGAGDGGTGGSAPRCSDTCPAGFTASESGVCAGGDLRALALNVETVSVSGTVTLNGAEMPYCDSGFTYVVFDDGRESFRFRAYQGDFDAALPKGTYRVSFDGDYACGRTPEGIALLEQGVEITGRVDDLAFDLRTVSVSGTVTLNGAEMPYCDSGFTYVVFDDGRERFRFRAYQGDFEAALPAGSYRVSFDGDYSCNRLPEGNTLMLCQVEVAAR